MWPHAACAIDCQADRTVSCTRIDHPATQVRLAKVEERWPKNTVKFSVYGTMKNSTRSDIEIGLHRAVIDEPKIRGGTDKGPTPTEMLAASLVGCTNVIVNRIAEQNDIKIHTMSIALETTFDVRGALGIAEIGTPFVRMDLSITMTTDADYVSVEMLKRELRKRCVAAAIRATDRRCILRTAAVVLGGASLFGGEGKLYKSVIGVFIMIVLANALNLANVHSYWQEVAVGLVIIAAAAADRWRHRR